MPADVVIDEHGAQLILRRAPAWHGLGAVFAQDERMTASQAVHRARIDDPLRLEPLTVRVGDTVVDTGRLAVTRSASSPPRVLGVVPRTYRVLQARVLGRMLDPLSRVWPVETAGALGDGRVIFLTLAAGQAEVGGDESRATS
jgi:hypothetical protein